MKHVEDRNGWYYVRISIPEDARHAFLSPVIKKSLKTRDKHLAAKRAIPVIEGIQNAIATARRTAGAGGHATTNRHVPIEPDAALAAIERWYQGQAKDAYVLHFNRLSPDLPAYGADRARHDELRRRLRLLKWREIDNFDGHLVAALRAYGVDIDVDHPVIPNLRLPFCRAWSVLEAITSAFRVGDFSGWEPDQSDADETSQGGAGATLGVGSASTMTIRDLLERFVASQALAPKDEREVRYYVERLIQFAGNIPISSVSTPMLDDFVVQLRRFPKTQRPEVKALSFREIIERYGDADDFADHRLANKTIRTKWFGAYNRMFKYAVRTLHALPANPVDGAIPAKKLDAPDERQQWSPEELGRLFRAPLFTGTSDVSDRGYRKEAGDLIKRDARYWLPIVSLWTGLRLDEIGAMKAAEVRQHEGVWVFDLRKRPLAGDRRVKNAKAQRLVPMHQRLIELGFVTYQQAQDEWLFPEIWASKRPGEPATAGYSKWFGLWREAHGFTERWKDFHAFRHTFKEACREAGLAEDVHDRLTGHAGSSNQEVSRSYGRSQITFLKSAIDKVTFPTFPPLSTTTSEPPQPDLGRHQAAQVPSEHGR